MGDEKPEDRTRLDALVDMCATWAGPRPGWDEGVVRCDPALICREVCELADRLRAGWYLTEARPIPADRLVVLARADLPDGPARTLLGVALDVMRTPEARPT